MIIYANIHMFIRQNNWIDSHRAQRRVNINQVSARVSFLTTQSAFLEDMHELYRASHEATPDHQHHRLIEGFELDLRRLRYTSELRVYRRSVAKGEILAMHTGLSSCDAELPLIAQCTT